uniref:Uncharacterized protein n=1 Tax=Noctiluca scintillans TaxID=2966 RepID=A0A7S1AKS9_NOCSC
MERQGSSDGLRSKGLLPAIGVGGAVYLITSVVSIGTLAMVGVGAGVGYGVGTWLSEQYEKKQAEKRNEPVDRLSPEIPDALQVSLMQWQVYLGSRAANQQLTSEQLEMLFGEFAEREPYHAQNVRIVQNMVNAVPSQTPSSRSTTPVVSSGVTIVPLAAEV